MSQWSEIMISIFSSCSFSSSQLHRRQFVMGEPQWEWSDADIRSEHIIVKRQDITMKQGRNFGILFWLLTRECCIASCQRSMYMYSSLSVSSKLCNFSPQTSHISICIFYYSTYLIKFLLLVLNTLFIPWTSSLWIKIGLNIYIEFTSYLNHLLGCHIKIFNSTFWLVNNYCPTERSTSSINKRLIFIDSDSQESPSEPQKEKSSYSLLRVINLARQMSIKSKIEIIKEIFFAKSPDQTFDLLPNIPSNN